MTNVMPIQHAAAAVSTEESRPCPFRGLEPYSAKDRGRLFGREGDLLIVRDRIFAAPTTVIMAAAGAGKTSFIDALLAPDLASRFDEHYDVAVHRSWSSADPWLELSQQLNLSSEGQAGVEPRASKGLILVLDQFEEAFQHSTSSAEMKKLRSGLKRLVKGERQVRIVLSLREDFLAHLSAFEDDLPNLFRNYHRLQSPNKEQAADIVIRTAAPTTVHEQGVARLIEGLTRSDGVVILPYLQIACRRLWLRESVEAGRGPFEYLGRFAAEVDSDVKAQERVVGMLNDHLLEQVAKLTSAERDLAARAVDFLVTSQGAKLPYELVSLSSHMNVSLETLRSALRKLSTARVLKDTKRGDQEWFELYHDMYAPGLFEWSRKLDAEQRRRRARVVLASALSVVFLVLFGLWSFHQERVRAEAALASAQVESAKRAKRELQLASVLNRAREREAQELPGEALLFRLAALALQDSDEGRRHISRLARPLARLIATLRIEGTNPGAFFLGRGAYVATVSQLSAPADPAFLGQGSRALAVSQSYPAVPLPPAFTNERPKALLGQSLVQIWSSDTGEPYRESLVVDGAVVSGDLSPNGRYLALSSSDGQSVVWDLGDDKGAFRELFREPCPVGGFLPSGELMLTCPQSRSVNVYASLPEKSFQARVLTNVSNVALGQGLMLLGLGKVESLDPMTLKVQQSYALKANELAFEAETGAQKVWVLAGEGGKADYRSQVIVFDRVTGTLEARLESLNLCCDLSIKANGEGDRLLLAGAKWDGMEALELVPGGSDERKFWLPLVGRIVAPAKDGSWLMVRADDLGAPVLWNLSEGVPMGHAAQLDAADDRWFEQDSQGTRLMSARVNSPDTPSSPDTSPGIAVNTASVSARGVAYIRGHRVAYRDLKTWVEVMPENDLYATGVSISDASNWVVVEYASDLVLWDVSNSSSVKLSVQPTDRNGASISPTGEHILIGGKEGLRLIDIASGTVSKVGDGGWASPEAIWAPSSSFAVSRGADFLVSTKSPNASQRLYLPWQNKVAVFSPDSAWLLTGTASGTRLSPLPDGPDIVFPFGPPVHAAFSGDSARFAVLAENRELRIFDRRSKRELTSLLLRATPRQLFFTPDTSGLVVANDRWLHLYRSENSDELRLQASRQLEGTWSGVYEFLDHAGTSLRTITGVHDKYLRREEIQFSGIPSVPPVAGVPAALLAEWSKRLGLKFSNDANDDILPNGVVSAPEPARRDTLSPDSPEHGPSGTPERHPPKDPSFSGGRSTNFR